ncbi:MAG: L,D-transpeptidase family protein [Thermoleophilaceae bacterium]
MLNREQISEALAGLDSQDREILDYSLRRRVPDADLATIFASDTAEVARRRAAAIELLAQRLDVQRGADLGHVLKALLESETWEAITAAPASEPHEAPPSQPEALAMRGHRPLGAMDNPGGGDPEADDPGAPEPTPAPATEQAKPDRSGRTARPVLVGIGVAILVLASAAVVAALTSGDGDAAGQPSDGSSVKPFTPQNEKVAEPFPADPQSAGQYPTARVLRKTALYTAPDGKVRLRIKPRTEWDSPRILSVVERRGRWLAVLVPELKNGQRAWVRETQVGALSAVSWSITADLSKRRILVRHEGRTVRTMRIGVGRADHPTPVGRYAVTDKLRVTDSGSPYGCCVLALTGHQTKLPAGWPGGDRLAVHATADLSGLGNAVSLGCMRTDPKDTRWMLGRIPLGTPVFIHA